MDMIAFPFWGFALDWDTSNLREVVNACIRHRVDERGVDA